MQGLVNSRAIGAAIFVVVISLCVCQQTRAQVGSGRDLRTDAHAQRQLRALEGRSVTQPGAAARDAVDARQRWLRGRHGPSSPAERRVDRRLESLSTPAIRPTTSLPRIPDDGGLPSSFDETPIFPRSGTSERVQILIDRAADGISEGRLDQARSDLELAESQLGQVEGTDGAAALRQQIASLRRQLTAR